MVDVVAVVVGTIIVVLVSAVVTVAAVEIVAVADVVVIVVVVSVAIFVVVDEVISVALSTSEWLFSISLSLSLYNLTSEHNVIEQWLVRIGIYKTFRNRKKECFNI